MKTLITAYRTYHKRIVYEVDIPEGLTEEELFDMIYESVNDSLEEELFDKTELSEGEPEDEDRFDVYTDKGEQITGGHL